MTEEDAFENDGLKKIFAKLFEAMIYAGSLKSMGGEHKKRLVINKMKELIDVDPELEDLFIFLIDKIIKIDRGELKINPKVKKLFCCI